MRGGRLGACAALLAGLLGACDQDGHACTLRGVVSQVAVDVSRLGAPAATSSARLCLDGGCTTTAVPAASGQPVAAWRRPVPDRPSVTVTLELTGPGGAVLYRGSGRVRPQQVEPNGPGCGAETVLPLLHAGTDGRITA